MQNLCVEIQGRVVVLVHNGLPYTPEEWRSIVALAARPDLDDLRVLVCDEGGSISSVQRAELVDAMGPHMPRAAVLTDSVLSRGVTTAIGWFKPGIKAFRVGEFEMVARYLGLTEKERAFASETAKRLQGELAGKARESA
jgi:hypothetical protein